MVDLTRERWFQLYQLAALEKDPAKLLAIVDEVNGLLDMGEGRQNQAEQSKRV
jgi:hypothetical protein